MRKMFTKHLLLCMLLSLFVGFASAQQKQVTGIVKDNQGEPLPTASVTIKGTKTATSTDINGKFSISAKNNDVLVFTFIGFNTKEVSVGTGSYLTVILGASTNSLNEVNIVTTALGIKKEDKNLGYAVSTIKGEDISRTNTVNPIAALQGKVAGVSINVMSAAGVQTSPYIQIRGAKVLGNQPGQANNQPIFVVDGNILQNSLQDADGTDGGSQLKNLNPDDYQSITVLKGAAATAIYGSRGLNGAIVITTKTGKAGQGLGIEFNSTYQTQNIYKSPIAFQNIYGRGQVFVREGSFAPDGTQYNTVGSWGPRMDGSLHPAIYDRTKLVPYSPQPDNWKTFYQNGNYVNNNIAFSGGGDQYNYRLSYTNNSSKGMLPNNGLNRNSFDFKGGGNLNKVFSTEVGVSYSNTVTKNFYAQGRYNYSGGQNLAFNTYYLPRNLDYAAWYAQYRKPDNTIDNSSIYGNLNSVVSAFSIFDKNSFRKQENSFLGYVQLKAQVTPWLDFSGKGNINFYKIFNETKNMGNLINNTGGSYAISALNTTNYNLLFMAHAAKKVMNKDLNIDFRLINEIYGDMMGEQANASTDGGLKVPNQFFLANSINNVKAYDNDNNYTGYGITKPSTRTIGIAGDLNLNYKEFINLELTGRNDWLSTLTYPVSIPGANNYSVFYPSANLSYSFYDQFKAQMPSWLSSGRLRASLAYVGNAGVAGAYSTGNGYTAGSVLNNNNQVVPSATQFNGDVKPNLNLKPQRQRSIELGTNFGLFEELVNVDFAWYKTNTFNQLLNLPAVIETGYSKLFINAGNIQNQGLEFLVNVTPIRSTNWHLDFAINGAVNHSKIKSLGYGIKEWELSGGYDGANVYAYEGGAFGVLTADVGSSSKIDPATGLPLLQVGSRITNTDPNLKYDLANYNLVNPVYSDAQKRINIGNIEPNFVGGISGTLRYKSLSLFTQVDGRFGGDVYSEAYNYAMGQGTLAQTLQFRDQEHGGVARIDSYTGQTRYDGVVPNAVFDAGQMSLLKPGTSIAGMTFRNAYDQGLVEPMKASVYYNTFYGYGTNLNANESVSKNTWLMLREITVGYRLPVSLVSKVGLRGARLNLTARNVGYLYKTLSADQNPESLQSNDPFRPYITGGVPFYRNYAVSLNITL